MERHVRLTSQLEEFGKKILPWPGRDGTKLGRVEGVSSKRVGLTKHYVNPKGLMPLESSTHPQNDVDTV